MENEKEQDKATGKDPVMHTYDKVIKTFSAPLRWTISEGWKQSELL